MLPNRPNRPGPGRPGPGRPGSSRPGPGLPARGAPPNRPRPAGEKNPLPWILGIGGGVLLILIVVVASSGTKPAPVKGKEAAPPPPAVKKPVDVSQLERDGQLACDEGLRLFKSLEPKISSRDSLSPEERSALKVEVKKSMDLMSKGMGYLSEAAEKSGHYYDTTRYGQAKKLAASIYNELK